ncbi:hypothetical protein HN51_009658 [Arachis hypogaea]|uniref:Helicase ATP-binding domain-containing protein n=1 Tax=Arachis hypogaea TaxID=3818 RepID=A0A445CYF5_ARAHY|nr:DEAD-box ATP-dependent RNA helicase 39 [Arachis hypogaea]QHO44178.1 DEAD-box ATP-dependent RNA helicase [Arachis hypogaea]RYR55972.1 hypothetical protein Ahy_A05g021791 isoform A [Arachis hypogaea]
MRRKGRELLNLCISLSSPLKPEPRASSFHGASRTFSPFSASSSSFSSSSSSSTVTPFVEDEKASAASKTQRESMILEEFRQRKLKGTSSSSSPDGGAEKKEGESTMVVSNFRELGVAEELAEVLEKIGDGVPSEIQCVVIPAVLEGKSLLLSSPAEPDRTLAYLLPLIQLLRRGEVGLDSKHPRAIVLCATEEKANECFSAAKYIMEIAEAKLAKQRSSPDNEHSNVSIGLLVGTPSEIIQYIEEGSVVPAEIRYMVLDDVDFMLGSGLDSNIHKILEPLQDHESKSSYKRLQTVLVTSPITEVLGDESPIVKHLERDHAGNISAISLEMDQGEVFQYTESLDALRKKVIEAMDTLV